jgi:putative spermidine/putrescine transport system permease protein
MSVTLLEPRGDVDPGPRPVRTGILSPRNKAALLLLPALIALVSTFMVPIIVMVRMSLNRGDPSGTIIPALSLDTYQAVLGNEYYWRITLRTIELGLVVTVATVVLSYPIALFLARTRSRWAGLLTGLAVAPLMMSSIVRSYGWMAILGSQGVVNSTLTDLGLISSPLPISSNFTAIVISMTEIMMPYTILGMLAGFGRLDRDLEHSAASLGSRPSGVFFRVIAPLSLPGVFTGGLLAFVLTISSFVTPQLVGGAKVNVLAIEVYNQATQTLNWPVAAALAIVLLFVFGGFVAVYQYATNKVVANL